MIINIPLQVDEKVIEEKLGQDYQNKIEEYLYKEVKAYLVSRGRNRYYVESKPEDGLRIIVDNYISKFIEENKNIIIEHAAEKLSKRLIKTKAAKEILEEKT